MKIVPALFLNLSIIIDSNTISISDGKTRAVLSPSTANPSTNSHRSAKIHLMSFNASFIVESLRPRFQLLLAIKRDIFQLFKSLFSSNIFRHFFFCRMPCFLTFFQELSFFTSVFFFHFLDPLFRGWHPMLSFYFLYVELPDVKAVNLHCRMICFANNNKWHVR